MSRNSCSFLIAVVATIAPVLAVNTNQFAVNAKDNIYGSGLTVMPAPSGGGGGNAPFSIRLGGVVAGRTIQFSSVTGTVDCCTVVSEPNGPDGNTANGGTNINPLGGLSGITHLNRRMFLVGVFLDDNAPAGPAPPTLDFTADFTAISPMLRQVFYIGDGKSESGATQTFVVPKQATRLFFGFADAWEFTGDPGWYDGNTGILIVALNADIGSGLLSAAKDVVVSPDRVYVLADNKVHMFHRFTMAEIHPAIDLARPGLVGADAISLVFDRDLAVVGRVEGVSPGTAFLFVSVYSNATPAALLWTWTGTQSVNRVGGGSSIAQVTGGDCLYVGSLGVINVNGVPQTRGLVVKLRLGGILHWEKWIDIDNFRQTAPSAVRGVSAHGGFSNVQATGWLTSNGVRRGFFQIFAESGGIAGPQHVWPEANSYGINATPGGPGKGVYALGAALAVNQPDEGTHDAIHILRRYSFDGTPLWTESFVDPGPPASQRVTVDVAADNGGVWVGAYLGYTSGPSRTYLRYVGFNREALTTRYVEEGSHFPHAIAARDGAAYIVGIAAATPGGSRGYVLKVTPR